MLNPTALVNPPATFNTLTPEEIGCVVYLGPALPPKGSDGLLLDAGHRLGLFEEMSKKALYARAGAHDCTELGKNETRWWQGVEVRVLWGDQSPFVIIWGIQALYKELEDAKATGRARPGGVNIVRMKGANHFVRCLPLPWFSVCTSVVLILDETDSCIGRNPSELYALS